MQGRDLNTFCFFTIPWSPKVNFLLRLPRCSFSRQCSLPFLHSFPEPWFPLKSQLKPHRLHDISIFNSSGTSRRDHNWALSINSAHLSHHCPGYLCLLASTKLSASRHCVPFPVTPKKPHTKQVCDSHSALLVTGGGHPAATEEASSQCALATLSVKEDHLHLPLLPHTHRSVKHRLFIQEHHPNLGTGKLS